MPRTKGKWPGSGRKCQICSHEQAGRIDYLIVSGQGTNGSGRRALAEKFGVSQSSITYHGKRHITPEYRAAVLAGPFGSEDALRQLAAQEGTSVLQNLRVMYNAHRARWLLSYEIGDDEKMIMHSKAMTDMLSRIAKITQEIAPPQTFVQNNVMQFFDHPEYIQTITKLTAALRPFPEARQAVALALRSLNGSTPMIETKAGHADIC